MIVALYLVASLLVGAGVDQPRLGGGFIQYWSGMKTGGMDEAKWRNVLDAMREAKLRTIIIQRTVADEVSFVPEGDEFLDSTGIILRYAEAHQIEVYVGLKEDSGWFKKWGDQPFLDALASENLRLARALQRRYGRSRAFRGWYIPQEMWNQDYTAVQLKDLGAYFRAVGAGCRAWARGRRVAVSPYFNPWIQPGEEGQGLLAPGPFALQYGEFLDEARLDLVMLQDGVGSRGLKISDLPGRVVPYFRAFRDLCRQKRVELWGNLESFEIVPGRPSKTDFRPADIDRFQEQIQVIAPYVQGRLVTFDFFHYMNPFGYLHEGADGGAYHLRERRLYAGYQELFVRAPGEP